MKDIAHVAIHGTTEPHAVLPGTEGDSDNQKVPPSISSTFISKKLLLDQGIAPIFVNLRKIESTYR